MVEAFSPNRTQRKTIKKNSDLIVTESSPEYTEEIYTLYKKYICTQHKDGDMYPPSKEQFTSFLVARPDFCSFFEFRQNGELLAVAVTDQLKNGLSATYTFYDPNASSKRSLGSYCILWQITRARNQGMKYLHLGYWIKNCQKMNYKIHYRPLQFYINGHWMVVK